MKRRIGLEFPLALGTSKATALPSSAALTSSVLRCFVDNDRIILLAVLLLWSHPYLLVAIRHNLSTFDNITTVLLQSHAFWRTPFQKDGEK